MSAVQAPEGGPQTAQVRLTAWIEAHQVASFFILTFVVSWSLGYSHTSAATASSVTRSLVLGASAR